jgi:hypothetical protein
VCVVLSFVPVLRDGIKVGRKEKMRCENEEKKTTDKRREER